ncbi:SMP-30/gluconolactonase/LRE family protein [Aureimonas psammosilenae]|uniref:SMP-30/gluconolactonase/LRE family protein n=1 Tax=Aureimonas psammosilenae TaxID=2495496 RepID=UPI001261393D|nr:SMP-30/gluconolactonase/LRE family protein [Aureimonas psammosilenae]
MSRPLPAPTDVRFEAADPVFKSYILGNAQMECLAEGFRWIEGPVWMGDWNCLLFEDIPRNRTMMWREAEGVSVWREPSDYSNGLARDRQGRLIACSHRGRCITRTEHDGSVTLLADRFEGKRLNAPNDVVVKGDGTIWFTDPLYGILSDYEGGRQEIEQPPALYRFDPRDGSLQSMSRDFDGPNGLAFSPDERRLYVSETGDQRQENPVQVLRVFDVSPDGALSNLRDFYKVEPGYTDGLAVDTDGNIWSSAEDGVHCISPEGKLLGRIFTPALVSNLCFGGSPYRNRLFLGVSHSLYAVYLNRRGARWPG